jgi:uncharacterized short protein YbdD (DUF466 family)
MENAVDIVFELNIMLYAKEFDQKHFEELWKRLKDNFNPRIGMLDFEKYNEITLKRAQKEKIKSIKHSNFEKAAALRQFQEECIKYVEIKNRYKIKRSIFICKDNFLVYVYIGNARNDKWIKEIKECYHFGEK